MADDVTQRMNYFDHQFLRVDDFSQEQSYQLDRRRRHNRLLHVWGIAEGLTLTAANGATGVTVQPGTAIDGAGREIVLANVSSAVDLSGHAGKVVYVTIAYGEELSDPTSDAGVQGNRRWTETPKIEISETPPAQQDQQLILGRVTLDNNSRSTGKADDGDGQNQRRLAGVVAGDLQANSLTLTNPEVAPDASPRFQADRNGFVQASGPFGPLKIQGDLGVAKSVGIGTLDTPKARLEVAGDVVVSGNSNVTMGRALLMMGRTDQSNPTANEVIGAIGFISNDGLNGQLSFRNRHGFELLDRQAEVPDLAYDFDSQEYADLKVRVLRTASCAILGPLSADAENTTSPRFPLDVAGEGRMRVRSGSNGSAGIMFYQTSTSSAEKPADRAFVGMNNYNTVGFWSSVAGISWGLLMDITKGRVRIGPDPTNQTIKTAWESSPIGSLNVAGNLYVAGPASKVDGPSWTVLSDLALKKNVKAVDDALNTLTRLRGVTFEWKRPEHHGNQTGPVMGLIAQEVEEVLPDWVTSDPEGTKLLTMRGFEALTIEACKELKSQLETERARNEELETRIRALEHLAVAP